MLYLIKQVELSIRARMDEVLRASGVTVLQYTALTVLRRRDGLSSAELARLSFVTAQAMGEMIATLERRGLLVRAENPDHGRRLSISLTSAGRTLLSTHDERIAALEGTMLADLATLEREELRDSLNRCRVALSKV
uniref:MarR family winged helix-turn-helix transcriptional regulator n=1 Tax=unclassified Rhodococcus (in: high G+C Gram-positive bacteria) TaxID=192944 RepID=UPI0020CED503|nr:MULTISPECIES: MarR family transcriptional regulator [unclassified Rhodococcus (in: high G+C Gram-positive bacteria)]